MGFKAAGTISVILVWEDTSAEVPVVSTSLSGAGINHVIKVQLSVRQQKHGSVTVSKM